MERSESMPCATRLPTAVAMCIQAPLGYQSRDYMMSQAMREVEPQPHRPTQWHHNTMLERGVQNIH